MRAASVFSGACALLVCGLATGVRGYYISSIALFAALIYALLSVLCGLMALSVEVKGGARRVSRGTSSDMTVRAALKSPFPLGRAAVWMVSGDYSGEREIVICPAPFGSRKLNWRTANAHMGVYRIGAVRLSARDVFGLFEFSRKLSGRTREIEVLPNVAEIRPMERANSGYTGASSNNATDDASSPAGVREWKRGDPLKRVHWKLSARKQELYVREFEESVRPDALIIPDMRSFTGFGERRRSIEDEIAEQTLANAAACVRAGFTARVLIYGEARSEEIISDEGGIEALRDVLMRAGFGGSGSYESVLKSAVGRLLRTGACVMITPEVSGGMVEMAARIASSNVAARVVCVSGAKTAQALDMLERLNASGVEVY